ncbi:MAG TPA: hypothetical protein PK114_08965 [Smithellaceae bacterium]|nr:hypothetical protein [Smithellaceae bacterium]
MNEVKVFTIGFTKKTAEEFFSRLLRAGVKRVIDIRLNNVSQLAGLREGLCGLVLEKRGLKRE